MSDIKNDRKLISTENSYKISAQSMLKIYMSNERFRGVIDTGNFLFCEERVVIRYEKYITVKDGKTVLTDYAKNNESECCLTFVLETWKGDTELQ